jgi:hypothetical protein
METLLIVLISAILGGYVGYKAGRHKMYYEIVSYLESTGGEYEFEVQDKDLH